MRSKNPNPVVERSRNDIEVPAKVTSTSLSDPDFRSVTVHFVLAHLSPFILKVILTSPLE